MRTVLPVDPNASISRFVSNGVIVKVLVGVILLIIAYEITAIYEQEKRISALEADHKLLITLQTQFETFRTQQFEIFQQQNTDQHMALMQQIMIVATRTPDKGGSTVK